MFKELYKKTNESIYADERLIEKLLKEADKKKHTKIFFSSLAAALIIICISLLPLKNSQTENTGSDISYSQTSSAQNIENIKFNTFFSTDMHVGAMTETARSFSASIEECKYCLPLNNNTCYTLPWRNPKYILYK